MASGSFRGGFAKPDTRRTWAPQPMREIVDPRHGKVAVTEHVYQLLEKDRREACPQKSEEWFAKRNDHVTASVMAAVCGDNPYESRRSMLLKKTGRGPRFKGNQATEHGNKYELPAIKKYEKLTGEKCLEFGLLESLNPGEEFLAGSPDGITTSGKLIEVKCPFRRIPTSVVPLYYVYQVQFLMHILKLEKCDFIQYVPETDVSDEIFIITAIYRNDTFWEEKFPMLVDFWKEVREVRALMAAGELKDDEEEEKKTVRVVRRRKKEVPCFVELDKPAEARQDQQGQQGQQDRRQEEDDEVYRVPAFLTGAMLKSIQENEAAAKEKERGCMIIFAGEQDGE